MNRDHAESIALLALQFLAGDTALMAQFFGATGMAPDDLRQASSSAEFQAGLLDFFLHDEPALLAFAASCDLAPEKVRNARFALVPPGESETW